MIQEDLLVQTITGALRNAFDTIRAQTGETEVVGYGVITNDDGRAFTPVAASQSEQVNGNWKSADDFRFNPENWDLRAPQEMAMPVYSALASLEADCTDDDNDEHWHEAFRSRAYQLFVRAMEGLVAAGYFDSSAASRAAFRMVWVVDSDIPDLRGRSWCKRLNDNETYRRFTAWLNASLPP
ncbi:MAG: DUF4303 domain-containing protein [Rhizobacter sp.]